MLISLFISILAFAPFSHGTEMVGAISAGMGGTGRTAVQANESLYLNPASIALLDRFYSGASIQSGFTEPGVNRHTMSLNFSDGSPGTAFPGSMGYRRHRVSDSVGEIFENEFKLGLGYRLTPRVSIGAAASYLDADDQGRQRRFTQYNSDLGLLFGLQPNWGLSITGENLLRSRTDLPNSLVRRSQVSLGTQYIYGGFLTGRYEVLMPIYTESESLLGHRVGFGVTLRHHFAISAGYAIDDQRGESWASAGIAWVGPRLKLAYSFQSESRSDLGQRHLVDLWFDL